MKNGAKRCELTKVTYLPIGSNNVPWGSVLTVHGWQAPKNQPAVIRHGVFEGELIALRIVRSVFQSCLTRHAALVATIAATVMMTGCSLAKLIQTGLPDIGGADITTNAAPSATVPPPVSSVPPSSSVPSVVIPPPPSSPATGHAIASIGPEEVCGAFEGDRPSVAVDSLGQPHAIVDKGVGNSLVIYHKIGGVWTESGFAQGSRGGAYDASRIYMPHMEIDDQDRAWISAKFGSKEYGGMKGVGIWMVPRVSTAPGAPAFVRVHLTEGAGNGNISIDRFSASSADPATDSHVVLMAKDGCWARLSALGEILSTGKLPLSGSGEKIRFLISPGGVWHAAFNGWTESDGCYQNTARQAAGKKRLTWSSSRVYPEQGIDMCHPAVGIDLVNPGVCYISSAYAVGVVVNIYDGAKFLHSPSNLLVVAAGGSGGVQGGRFGPQWASTRDGGAFVSWTKGGRIWMRHVSTAGTMEAPINVCAGRAATFTTDRDGNLHMIYNNGGMRYRKIVLK